MLWCCVFSLLSVFIWSSFGSGRDWRSNGNNDTTGWPIVMDFVNQLTQKFRYFLLVVTPLSAGILLLLLPTFNSQAFLSFFFTFAICYILFAFTENNNKKKKQKQNKK